MKRSAGIAIGVIAVIAALGTAIASSSPDGLNRVAADLGFAGRATAPHDAPLAGYAAPLVPAPVAGGVAGLIGAAAVGGLTWGIGRLLRRRS